MVDSVGYGGGSDAQAIKGEDAIVCGGGAAHHVVEHHTKVPHLTAQHLTLVSGGWGRREVRGGAGREMQGDSGRLVFEYIHEIASATCSCNMM